jgi:hypothetical protein
MLSRGTEIVRRVSGSIGCGAWAVVAVSHFRDYALEILVPTSYNWYLENLTPLLAAVLQCSGQGSSTG